MTNFQGGTPARVTREQILLWTPVALGGVVALAAAVLMLLPAVQQLSRKQQELTDLKEQEARVPLLRQQLTQQQETLEEAQQREKQILQLIAGSGDISTFMAQLSREARSSGVQLDSYEPVTGRPDASRCPQPAAAGSSRWSSGCGGGCRGSPGGTRTPENQCADHRQGQRPTAAGLSAPP